MKVCLRLQSQIFGLVWKLTHSSFSFIQNPLAALEKIKEKVRKQKELLSKTDENNENVLGKFRTLSSVDGWQRESRESSKDICFLFLIRHDIYFQVEENFTRAQIMLPQLVHYMKKLT
jgi:hypothetical protein